MFKIKAQINGKSIKYARVLRAITFTTTCDKYHINHISWNFGDGYYSNKIITKHRFTTPGTKTIKCLINNFHTLTIKIKVFNNIDPNAINLRYVNQTNIPNINVVTFQKNVAASFDTNVTAWSVINLIDKKTIIYDPDLTIAYQDSHGNLTSRLSVEPGQQFLATIGGILEFNGPATSNKEIELLNGISSDTITAIIYRTSKEVGRMGPISNGQKAVFQFKPTIWVGVDDTISQGDILNSSVISGFNTEISLLGIKSADIIITGSGTEPDPFSFSLGNVTF